MTIKANKFIIRSAPHSVDAVWRLLHYAINALLLLFIFLNLPSCLCSEFFKMKSTTNKPAAIAADHSLMLKTSVFLGVTLI